MTLKQAKLTMASTAWHLRLVRRFASGFQPRDLCSYFWAVVGAVGLMTFIVLSAPAWWPAKQMARVLGPLVSAKPPSRVTEIIAKCLIIISGIAVGGSLLFILAWLIWAVVIYWSVIWAWVAAHILNFGNGNRFISIFYFCSHFFLPL